MLYYIVGAIDEDYTRFHRSSGVEQIRLLLILKITRYHVIILHVELYSQEADVPVFGVVTSGCATLLITVSAFLEAVSVALCSLSVLPWEIG